MGQPFSRGEMVETLSACADLAVALRHLRELVMARLICRDLGGLADLTEVTATCTDLAELAIQRGVEALHAELVAIHGEPLDNAGRPQQLMVVGMGKLGGRELNVSSDIDLIFVYPEGGETAGPRRIETHEFFTRLGKRLIALIDEVTADGRVFRVDMRLRPYGEEGPLVSSLAMLEDYFYTQAREWERYAWIKGRALTGDQIDALEALRRPFVFRKYFDYGAFAAMRDLHAQIRREVLRKDRADNVKLGPGGIREIEFIAQVQQLVRGGREPPLQIRPTQQVLSLLPAAQLLPQDTVDQLRHAYVFLRDCEHRLQYLDDAQTQDLPTDAGDRQRMAEAQGFADWAAFYEYLTALRLGVAQTFETLFATERETDTHPLLGLCDRPATEAIAALAELGFSDPAARYQHLIAFRSSARYRSLPAANQLAVDALLPPLVSASAVLDNPDDTLTRMLTLLETICRRAPYLRLLSEYPATLQQVARVCGSSPWAAQYLTRQPYLLDELIDTRQHGNAIDWAEARRTLAAQLADLNDDTERAMDALRHFKQTHTLRLLARDLAGDLALETLSDRLSELADLLLAVTIGHVWSSLPRRHRDTPAFAVIAYGKLGGKELGYASDLDLVFLFDDDHPDAQDTYARLAQRISAWLSAVTPAGILYETDLRLRPDGASGLLVSRIEAYADYQQTHAWTWEHQALTRARFCCGDATIGTRFEAIRRHILALPREREKLRTEVLAMRQKMHDGHPNRSDLFDLKHDSGGLVDCEFAVQYLVLAHAGQHPELLDNCGNIALLHRAASAGIVTQGIAEAAANAYRALRRRQHAAKLQGLEAARCPAAEVATHRHAVRQLWDSVFGVTR
jgi:[glutamine synthetase] adenylyltransferase / [glutamine synthetase]-adenylyl-L-tyrosine phosphorylase